MRFFDYILQVITFITNVTDTNGVKSHLSVQDEGTVDGNATGNKTPGNEQHDDDDDVDIQVDGPRVEAHVDLAKIACKYMLRHSIPQKYTDLHE